MKKMKTNFLKVVMILFIGVLTLEGCRKGENDPLLSLRSRDARVTGEWKLVEFESTSTSVANSGSMSFTSTTTNTYNGTTWTVTNPGGTSSNSYTRNMIIEKDGGYTYKETYDGNSEEENGKWSWLSDAKKKTRILLDNHGIFYIDQLKNSEMIIVEDTEYSYVDNDGDTGKETYTSRAVYEKVK